MDSCFITYFSLCHAYQFAPPWECVVAEPWSMLGPSYPTVALAKLVEHHTEQALVDSGIACRDAEGQLMLHASFASPDVGIIMLRDSESGELRDLLTETGCLLGRELPLFEVLADKHTADALAGNHRFLFLTAGLRDAVLLRSFGLAAVPLVGLDRLDKRNFDLLIEYYDLDYGPSEREMGEAEQEDLSLLAYPPDPASTRHPSAKNSTASPDAVAAATAARAAAVAAVDARIQERALCTPFWMHGKGFVLRKDYDPVPLAIVQWLPHSFSRTEPEAARRVMRELEELHAYRRLDMSGILAWLPSDRDMAKMQFAMSRGEASWLQDAFLDSVQSSVGLMRSNETDAGSSVPPTDLAAAIEELHEAMLDDGMPRRQRYTKALANYRRVTARRITGPMLRHAEAEADPLKRAMQIQFAQLNALFLEKMPLVHEQVLRGVAQPKEGLKHGGDKSVPELLTISSQLVTLAKEMMYGNQAVPKRPRSMRLGRR